MGTEYECTLVIDKIEEITKDTANVQGDCKYKLTAKDVSDGIPRILMTSPEPFLGLKPDMVIQVTISTPQTTLASHAPNVPTPGGEEPGRPVKAEEIIPKDDESEDSEKEE